MVLALFAECLLVGMAITVVPALFQSTRALALWLVVLAAVGLAVAVVENAGVMTMVSLSEAYGKANADERAHLEMIRLIAASERNWPHFIGRMFDGATFFVFYAALYRSALIPRVLAGLGLAAVALQVIAVGLPLFGHDVVFEMLAPIGLTQLIVAVWLIVKGFRVQPITESGLPA